MKKALSLIIASLFIITIAITALPVSAATSFKDVYPNDYYSSAVNWAVSKGITTGTSSSTFSPNDGCTRGQVVTFLWRFAGSPTPKITFNPFSDVKTSDYYYKAVLWAVEYGITNGTSTNMYSPSATCTRGQIVTFLWRAYGSPSISVSYNNFKDVKASDYFYTAVLWAVANGITNGTSNSAFSPNDTCTRGQVVTFLYRSAGGTDTGYNAELAALTSQYNSDVAVLYSLMDDCYDEIEKAQTAITNATRALSGLSPEAPDYYVSKFIQENLTIYGNSYAAGQAAREKWRKEYNEKAAQYNATITNNQMKLSTAQTNLQNYTNMLQTITTVYNANVAALKAKYGIN